jgi:hypothetical protein
MQSRLEVFIVRGVFEFLVFVLSLERLRELLEWGDELENGLQKHYLDLRVTCICCSVHLKLL